jgi:hypothetical protein
VGKINVHIQSSFNNSMSDAEGVLLETYAASELSSTVRKEIRDWEQVFQQNEPSLSWEKHPGLAIKLICTHPVERALLYPITSAVIGRNKSDRSLVVLWLNSVKQTWVDGKIMQLQYGHTARIARHLRGKHFSEDMLKLVYEHTFNSLPTGSLSFSTAAVSQSNTASIKMNARVGNHILSRRNTYLLHSSVFQGTTTPHLAEQPQLLSLEQITELWEHAFQKDNGRLVHLKDILSLDNNL